MQKWIPICSVLLLNACFQHQEIRILTGSNPSPTIQFAANELAEMPGDINPDTRFTIHSRNRSRGTSIRLSTKIVSLNSNIRLPEQLGGAFSITNDGKVAVIAGFDEPGVLQGVYHLLEKLGYDFQLSQVISSQAKEDFNFDAWDLSDFPLQQERIVFNWHNFLSGCTGWDLEDWKEWILHSARLGFNTIMIHTYGNNPIHSFAHSGVEKPLGYLATTTSGRDWGTEHVNDIRRLIGGDHFDQAVFGSQAALVQDSMRIAAARSLMQEVFLYAHMVGLKINFAFDMDTRSANPQEILSSLPEQAHLKTADGYFLANPETKEGYAFYKSQIMALLNDYPQIDRLVVWTRKYNAKPPWLTPARSLTPDQFPFEYYAYHCALQTEYYRALRAAGVMQFAGLNSNYKGSKTSDIFIDIDELVIEPHIWSYVRDAFSPEAVCLWFWEDQAIRGSKKTIPIILLNDLPVPLESQIKISFVKDHQEISNTVLPPVHVGPSGKVIIQESIDFPDEPGDYRLIAEIIDQNNNPVRSVRKIEIR